ncbi:SDR family NAD(P)-dependent oxidoreductase [Nocardioides limicola]|uniref:SDR family NAD(P)-dependent oxidoreductase n=1 Tax=Nocardioides limicola TaxID=2803368 RepID=UPI00193BCF93|nr:SDR family NAD(P)-dependent oxidoreductase [Nocardioides sp. DJM-14]
MSKTALITGGTAGIGRAFADALAADGHDLILVARDAQRLADTAAELSAVHQIAVETIAADLSVREDVDRVAGRLSDPGRPVDLLVNNAGFGLKGRFADNPIDAEQALLDVLVTAVLRLSHAALLPMAERGSGAIINVSSVAAFLPRGSYSAAKAWVNSFSEWAHQEYADRGVSVMALCPGFVRTEFHPRMEVGHDSAPTFMWLDAAAVAADALADLRRGRAISIPSKRYKLLVAGSRAIPRGLLQRAQSLGRK